MRRGINDLSTPCFVLDREEFERSISGFENALRGRFSDSILGYSVKTNSLPYCLFIAKERGCYAEVVSSDEYELALLCGFPKNRIVYNGPMKSKESFLDAILNGAIVNIETHRELEWLNELPQSGSFSVGLRLNINISSVSPSDAVGENDNSRFGFSDETDEFSNALDIVSGLKNIRLSGLHLHRTAKSRSILFYQNSLRSTCEIIAKYGLNLDYIDIGGGFFGFFMNKPTYQQYVDGFYSVLSEYKLDSLRIIVEPGNALVASCFSFVSEVIDVKHVEENLWFITTDGSRNDIDPFFQKSSYFYDLLTSRDTPVVCEQVISGCTCLEYDRLFTLKDAHMLSTGDRILYNNVGAYTMCLSPMFIRYIPNVYVKNDNGYELIREKWTANEYIQKSKY